MTKYTIEDMTNDKNLLVFVTDGELAEIEIIEQVAKYTGFFPYWGEAYEVRSLMDRGYALFTKYLHSISVDDKVKDKGEPCASLTRLSNDTFKLWFNTFYYKEA
jgi:hypothetical protein